MAKRKKHEEHEEEAGEAWLLPYSDLMTLLLAVFIVLFAVSQTDSSKMEAMAQAFQNVALTGGAGIFEKDGSDPVTVIPNDSGDQNDTKDSSATPVPTPTPNSDGNQDNFSAQDLQNLQNVQSTLNQYFAQNNLQSSVSTYIDERGLVISLNNAILFDSGSAAIKPKNKKVLIKIGTIINQLKNYIRIEGHTDNRPIKTVLYPSNWELSSARSSQVLRLFIKSAKIPPQKMAAVGYAEYRPIASNKTALGRAKNRRIDLIILNRQYNSLEEQPSNIKKMN